MINILKNIGLVGVVILILTALGTAINAIVPWAWLTDFFTLLRHLTDLIDFTWDTSTMWTIVGLSMTIFVAEWVFRAGITAVDYLRGK